MIELGTYQAGRQAWSEYTEDAYHDLPQNDYLTHKYRHNEYVNLLDDAQLPENRRSDPTLGFYTKQLIEKIKHGTCFR